MEVSMAALKPVVIGIVFKRAPSGALMILTQRRISNPLYPLYDPIYGDTQEAVGETLKEGESVLDALMRGCAEECGHPDFSPLRIYGAEGRLTWTTGKKDTILCCDPFCFVQQMGPPQPWLGPVFAVEVSQDFAPDHSKSDGESAAPQWWTAAELRNAIADNPSKFMGLHMPAYEKFCDAVLAGKF